MTDYTLVIGNQNYSSWSMRAWLVLRHFDLPFRERKIWLDTPTATAEKLAASPAGKVPVLLDGDLAIWDSLAICEYVAEGHGDRPMWPRDRAARARARSLAAEMHSGFAALRSALPMNIRARKLGADRGAAVRGDVERIHAAWADTRARFGGPGGFLFGDFGIVDAFFAPVAMRFVTYAVASSGAAADYVAAMQELPAVREWCAGAEAETVRLAAYDAIG